MDEDRIKGKMKDIAGRVERKVGEWTGDKDAQAEGAGKQIEGKIENTVGKVKDAARDALKRKQEQSEAERVRREDEDAA